MLAPPIRPLGLDELLDRAVTIFVRRFAAIMAALAVVYIPFLILQWFLIGSALAGSRRGLTLGEWRAFALDMLLFAIVFFFSRTAAAVEARETSPFSLAGLQAAYGHATRRFGLSP